ncbi:MAG TPA: MotA/TolQ/ExbB proton channel family protein [Candidatus Binataceae bacterium]|nr:MotA/TolQ/ExbB proton channel family protein [Candidatus Binataceae bacterium]
MESNFSILAMIQQGYYATYPLLFISVVCLAIIFERVWALWGIGPRTAKLADTLIPQLRQGQFEDALKATQARTTAAERLYHTLIAASQTLDREHLLEIDDERRYQEGLEFKRYIWVLATTGASAPFIGLFGTVVGILVSFQQMAIMGTGGFSVVAAGISEALISTALGLAVAIIAVIFFNYFSVKVENISAMLHVNADRLIDAAMQGRSGSGS